MAFDPNELFAEKEQLRYPRIEPRHVTPKTYAGGTDLLPVGTPMVFNTGNQTWAPWAAADTRVDGFVYPDEVQLVAGSEVLGQTMLTGFIHYDDIPSQGGDQAAFDTVLKGDGAGPSPRELGLNITGLDGVH